MEEFIKKANEYLKTQNYLVIYSAYVRPTGFIKITEILSITTSGFITLSQKGNKIKNTFPFNNLTGVSIQENVVTLTFGKIIYSFESNETSQIIYNIKDVISHTLTIFEQQIINIDDFKIIPQVSQNGFAAECRLMNSITQYPEKDKYVDEIKKILVYMQPTVDLSNYKSIGEIISPFLNVLPFSPNIQKLEIPKIPNVDTYDIIRTFIKNRFFLKHLSIEGEKTRFFSEFLSLLKHNQYSKLNGHSFTNTKMERNELDLLYKYCTEEKIQSLGFHQAIQKESFDYFITSFLKPELFDTLYILNLSGNPKIEICKLLPKLRQISYLSLSDCQCEICDVLNYVSNMNRIKCIDLSHNKCSSTFNKTQSSTLRFPPSFDTLIIDNVSFASVCIIPFFNFIFSRFEHGLKLSISSLITTGEVWSQFFDFLSTSSFRSLVSLNWDKNPLNLKLFTFLLKNPFFESLSLNSCFSSSASLSDSLNSFGTFIQSSTALKYLYVRGDESKYLGSSLNSLLKMITNSKSLKFIDISYSKSGDSGIQNILNFILQPRLSVDKIVFDDTMPSTKDSLFSLLRKAAKLKEKILISFPENDVNRLLQSNKATKDEINSLRADFVISKNSQEMDSDIESYFSQPYNVYRHFDEEKFPFYITQDEINRLANERFLIEHLPENSSPKRVSPKENLIEQKENSNKNKKQLQPIKNNFIKLNDKTPDRSRQKKPANNIDEISHQIFEFDVEKEKKRLNQTSNKQNNNKVKDDDDDDDNIFNLNTKKRHAQSLRRQRKVTNNNDNDNNNKNLLLINEVKDMPRRTRTQSTRVKRKVTTKTNSNAKRSENKEKVDHIENNEIIEKAKKRRGRSVDSIKKEKNKNSVPSDRVTEKPKELIKKKSKNDYDSEDYNLNSNESTASFEDDQKHLKLKNNKNKDDDDLNVTAPILRGGTKKASLNKTTKSVKQKSSRDKTRKKVAVEKIIVHDDDDNDVNDDIIVKTPTRRTNRKDNVNDDIAVKTPTRRTNNNNNTSKEIVKKKKTISSTTSNNKKRNAFDDDDDNEVENVVEPIKYKSIDWKFPNIKLNKNENDFWEKFKSQFDYDKLVEI